MAFSWLPFGAIRASATARAAALAASKLEALTSPDGAITMVAGGKQTKGALPVKTAHFDSALYTSRGRGYARYNEDGAELFSDARGHLYAAVFDQAGGLGGRVRGEASLLAAREVYDAFRAIAAAKPDLDPADRLFEGLMLAHHALVQRGEGEVTTAVAFVGRPNGCTIVSSGDSAALRFDRQGKFVDQTVKHEATSPLGVGALTHALGLVPESATPDVYRWPIHVGETLLLCTDGLLDSGLDGDQVGKVLREAESAEDAVNQLARWVLRRMTLMQAKPDNLTMICVRPLAKA